MRVVAVLVFTGLLLCSNPAAASLPDGGVAPCEDFYRFACGTWLQTHPIPADRASWDPYYELAQQNAVAVRDIVEHAPTDGGDGQKVADDYASCMDEPAIERAGLNPLAPEFARIDKSAAPGLVDALAGLHGMGGDAVVSLEVIQDPVDARAMLLTFDLAPPAMGDRTYYFKEDPASVTLRTTYRNHVARMLEMSGLTQAAAAAGADAILKFETELARVTPPPEEQRDPKKRYHPLTAAQLGALTPAFSWKAYFEALGVPQPAVVSVAGPEALTAAFKAWNEMPRDQQKVFLRWRLLDQLASVMPERFVQADFQFFSTTLHGTKQMQPRWQRCGRLVNRHLGEAIGRLFVQTHLSSAEKQRVLDMILLIQSAFRDDLRTLNWMSEATRAAALAKLEVYRIKVGYPERWRDYSALEIKRGDSTGNAIRAKRFEFRRRINKLGKPVDRDEWFSRPQDVDGYESSALVEVVFTAGILQPPFFDANADDAANFGALGRVIGHELTHGFDDTGRRFDRDGNLKDWWAPVDTKAFEARAQCFVDQYSTFTVVDGQKLNGKLTLGENIADNGGMRLAYAALQARLAGKPRGLVEGQTPEQQLFTAFAHTQCVNTTEASLKSALLRDEHSPGGIRVNATLSNMPEFQRAFSCKPTDAMVNPHPCRLW
jgi:endothelin-converting enzyme/putative endopeptidase